MEPPPAELAALVRRDPRLGAAMRRVPPFPSFPRGAHRGSHFQAIARSIIYQQLATPAAATIYARVRALTSGPAFPTPPKLLAIPDSELRAAGLSSGKRRALQDLARRSTSGELQLRTLGRLPDDEVIARLTTVWGVGEWTAQMFLLFKLGRLDVMAPNDLGLQEGLRILDDLDSRPSPTDLATRADSWRPLRSVASWTLWRLVELHR